MYTAKSKADLKQLLTSSSATLPPGPKAGPQIIKGHGTLTGLRTAEPNETSNRHKRQTENSNQLPNTGVTVSLSLTEAELRLATDSYQSNINPTQALSPQELVPVTFPELTLSHTLNRVTDVLVWMYASGSASANQHVVFCVKTS